MRAILAMWLWLRRPAPATEPPKAPVVKEPLPTQAPVNDHGRMYTAGKWSLFHQRSVPWAVHYLTLNEMYRPKEFRQ